MDEAKQTTLLAVRQMQLEAGGRKFESQSGIFENFYFGGSLNSFIQMAGDAKHRLIKTLCITLFGTAKQINSVLKCSVQFSFLSDFNFPTMYEASQAIIYDNELVGITDCRIDGIESGCCNVGDRDVN